MNRCVSAPPHSAFLPISQSRSLRFCKFATSLRHSIVEDFHVLPFHTLNPFCSVLAWSISLSKIFRFGESATSPRFPCERVCVWFPFRFSRWGGRDFGSGRIAGARGDRASYLAFSVRRRYLPPLCADWCTMAAQPYRRLNTGESWIWLVNLFKKRRHLTGQRGQTM